MTIGIQGDDEASRKALYDRLKSGIGNTDFFQLKGIEFARNCRVYVKAEYQNPTGSHYDREMILLLEALEARRSIVPGRTRMLETTTGNSGSSFAWLCRALGYPAPKIVIPTDMPRARKQQIASFGAELIESAKGQYISGIEDSFGQIYRSQTEVSDPSELLVCPRHWEDENHGVEGMRACGREIVSQSARLGVELDRFVFALGNGSSSRGIGEVLTDYGVKLHGMEPAESPIVAEHLQLEGFKEPLTGDRSHGIIGTGPSEARQVYKNMRAAAKLLETIVHVSTEEAAEMQVLLADRAVQHVGMSSAACVVGIQKLIENEGLRNEKIGTVFYDPSWKYLT